MKIIIAPDSFKGTLSAPEAADIIADALREKLPTAQLVKLPIADGGEGSTDCLLAALGGGYAVATVKNCFFEDAQVRLGITDNGETAIIEVAAAAGLAFAEGRKNPLFTTTYGVGQMLSVAAGLGVHRVLLCLGGSATNDLGCGAAAALGVRFLDANGEELLPLGGTLDEVASVDVSGLDPRIAGMEILCLTDVTGTLTGENGAARMFAPQKGASPQAVELLEAGAIHLAEIIERDIGIDVLPMIGGGAAGGFGAGAVAFLGAELCRGIETVLARIGFAKALSGADAVITGEGRTDAQSACGKAVSGVAAAAKAAAVPVILLSGAVSADAKVGADAMLSTLTDFCTFADVCDHAAENLRKAAENLGTLLSIGYGV